MPLHLGGHLGYMCMIQLWIWMTSVTCATIDDFMTFVIRTYRALDVILRHISRFRCDLWIFTYVTWSMIDDFMSPDFWPVIRSMPILGHISFSIEIYGSSWSCMLIPTYEIHTDMIVSSVEPLRSYPVRPALRYASMSSCFPSERRPFDLWVWFSCTRGWLGSRIRWRVIWAHLVLLTYHTLCLIALMWAILGMDSRAFWLWWTGSYGMTLH